MEVVKMKRLFIYGGLPKTGSTWLYSVLCEHPEVNLPPIKELKHFGLKEEYGGKIALWQKLFSNKRFVGGGDDHARLRTLFLMRLKHRLNRSGLFPLKKILWLCSCFIGLGSDRWYESFLSEGEGKISGDITPNYCELSEESISEIRKLYPHSKVILGLRDPIDRFWSGVKMKMRHQFEITELSELSGDERLFLYKKLSFHSNDYNDYTALVEKWRKYFGEKQLFVYYFEELQEDPEQLLKRICQFLEIDDSLTQPLKVKAKKNKNRGLEIKMPLPLIKVRARLVYKQIKRFAKAYPNRYTLGWLEKYREYVD